MPVTYNKDRRWDKTNFSSLSVFCHGHLPFELLRLNTMSAGTQVPKPWLTRASCSGLLAGAGELPGVQFSEEEGSSHLSQPLANLLAPQGPSVWSAPQPLTARVPAVSLSPCSWAGPVTRC